MIFWISKEGLNEYYDYDKIRVYYDGESKIIKQGQDIKVIINENERKWKYYLTVGYPNDSIKELTFYDSKTGEDLTQKLLDNGNTITFSYGQTSLKGLGYENLKPLGVDEVDVVMNESLLPSKVNVTKYLENCSVNIDDDVITTGEHYIRVVADEGYKFKQVPYIAMEGDRYNFSKGGSDRIYSIDLEVTDNIEIYATGEKDIVLYPVETNLVGCDINIGKEVEGGVRIIRLEAHKGYEFKETPYLIMEGERQYFSVNPLNKTLATITVDIVDKVTIRGIASKKEVRNWNVITHLYNSTLNYEDDTIPDRTRFNFIVKANKDCFFSRDIPTITMDREVYEMVLNEDKTVASLEITISGDVNISALAYSNQKVRLTGEFINCKSNYLDGELLDHKNKPVQIIADEGYSFKGEYRYLIGGDGGLLKKVDDNTRLVVPALSDDIDDLLLYDTYNASKIVKSLGGFINIYKTNNNELKELSKKRIVTKDYELFDYGQFIYNLYILPFKLDDSLIADKSNIILGSLDSDVSSTLVNDYYFNYDGGVINVDPKYNNMYDFINTECYIHTPFIDKIYVPSEYVINQKLEVSFTIDLYNKSMLTTVKSSFNDTNIVNTQNDIGLSIPFIQENKNQIVSKNNSIFKNRLDKCYVEIVRNIPYEKNSDIFGGATNEVGIIGDYEGYIECKNVILETKATKQEQEEIKQLLAKGVFI